MFHYHFRQISTEAEIDKLTKFILKYSLSYPKYGQWVKKAQEELISGYKKAIIAISDNSLVGNLIYQPHKKMPDTLEIKNLRISHEFREKSFARFMLRQAELEAIKGGFSFVTCDVRASEKNTIKFMQNAGYIPVRLISLYDSSKDIVLVKTLNR